MTRSTTALNTALSGFADAYNAAADELRPSGVNRPGRSREVQSPQLASLMSSISTFSSGGQINGLEAWGWNWGQTGISPTYSPFTLIGADLANSSSVAAFLGSATGGGFLKNASDILNSVEFRPRA